MRRIAMLCLLVAGCARAFDAKDIELTLNVGSDVSDAEVATVKSLDVAVTGDAQATMTYRLDRPLLRSERLVVHFTAAKGHVTVSVLARDAQSLIALRGNTGDIDLEIGGAHKTAASLTPLPGGQHLASAINLLPAQFTLFTGQTLQLGTDGEPVTWSSTEATVDDSGLFTAPATAGTYHVLANSKLYPTDQGTVTLNVLATGIARFAGNAGGVGSIDGVGAAARINSPWSAVLAPSGVVYFTDGGEEIRKLDPTTGAVTTIAGRPDHASSADGAGASAGFNDPTGLAFDGNQTLYVAEAGCGCIRAVNVGTGQTTTLAGSNGVRGSMDGVGSAAMLFFPTGLAYDPAQKLLYFADMGTHTIRTLDVTTNTVKTIAGVPLMAGNVDGAAAQAKLNQPQHLVLDGNAVYVRDFGNQSIRKLDLGTMTVSTLVKNVDSPSMFSRGDGTLLLASPLRSVDEASGKVSELDDAKRQAVYGWWNAFVPAPDGTFLAGEITSWNRYDLTKDVNVDGRTVLAGYFVAWRETEGPRARARIDSFGAMTVRSDGVIFGKDNRIFRIDADGTIHAVTGAGIDGGGQMAFGADGKLYVANWHDQTLMRVDVDNAAIGVVAGQEGTFGYADGVGTEAEFNGIDSVAADGNKIYITERGNQTVRVFDIATSAVTTLAGVAGMCAYVDGDHATARLCDVRGVAPDGNGNLYVTANNVVRKIVIATGAVSTLAGTGTPGFVDGAAATAQFWGPYRLALDPAKKSLYVSEEGNDTIRKIDVASGAVSTVAGVPGRTEVVEGALPGAINQPGTLAFAASGELLVAVPRESALVQIRLP